MKISVIVPVYNCEKYLPNCIDSICNQTYDNLQIILINDGSTDASGKICDEFAKKDSRITVVHQTNKGVSAARNAALSLISGDFVSFIDADDFLDPDMYAFLLDLMSRHDADIVHCGYRRIVNGQVELQQNTQKLHVQNRDDALYCMVAGKLFHCGLWNKLYRADILKGLSFNESIKINEDILFNFQAFTRAEQLVYIDVPKYNYVVHPNSACTSTQELRKALDSCFVNQTMLNQLIDTDLESIARSRYMRSLSTCYRAYCSSNSPKYYRKNISQQIWAEVQTKNVSELRMVITAHFIHWMPWLYRITYSVYSKFRKPRWEPEDIE